MENTKQTLKKPVERQLIQKPRYMCIVKNDFIGKSFIALLKGFLNTQTYSLQLRGRHSNRVKLFKTKKIVENHTRDVPVQYSEKIAIYLNKK